MMSSSKIDQIAAAARKVSSEEDRRQRFQQVLQELLQERQQLLVGFCELAGHESIDSDVTIVIEKLYKFVQTLVDYTALGHFEIYERIIDGKERRQSVNDLAKEVYPAIADTTRLFVEFNDKYDGADDDDSLFDLHDDLSRIGECLALRIESEDRLLSEMNRSKSPEPAALS